MTAEEIGVITKCKPTRREMRPFCHLAPQKKSGKSGPKKGRTRAYLPANPRWPLRYAFAVNRSIAMLASTLTVTVDPDTPGTGVHFAPLPTCRLSTVPTSAAVPSVTVTVAARGGDGGCGCVSTPATTALATTPVGMIASSTSTATDELSGMSNRFASTPPVAAAWIA